MRKFVAFLVCGTGAAVAVALPTSLPTFLATAASAAPAAPPAVAPASAAPAAPSAAAPTVAGPAVERRLHVSSAEASSFLWDDFNKFQQNYHPLYIGDDDPRTAWVEGVKGQGEGEWLRLKFTPMEGATRVRLLIRNGYQKTDRLYALNSRLKEVALKLLPGGQTLKATLKDEKGFQELVLTQPAGAFEGVELRVGSVYPGSKWDDLTVSDLQVYVTATTRENPAYEKARLDKILKWKKERADTAAAFASSTKQQMPILAQYSLVAQEHKLAEPAAGTIPACGKDRYSFACEVGLTLARAEQLKVGKEESRRLAQQLNAKGYAELVPVKLALVDRRPIPPTDGLCIPDLNSCNEGCYEGIQLPQVNAIGFLATSGFNTFEDKAQPTVDAALNHRPHECSRPDSGKAYYYAYRQKTAEGRDTVRALLTVRCGGVESREGSRAEASGQLLVYSDQGQLELIVNQSAVEELTFSERAGQKVLTAARAINSETVRTLTEPVKVVAK